MPGLEGAVEAVQAAGRRLLELQREGCELESKGHLDVVTRADREIHSFLSEQLSRLYPETPIWSEEGTASPPRPSSCWIIDPVDGTKNFGRGLPGFCVLAALQREGETVLSITAEPARGELFLAEKGAGAWRMTNGDAPRRLWLDESPVALGQAMLASGFPSGKRHRHLPTEPFLTLASQAMGVRRTGSTGLDLAYAAAGGFDAAWDWGLEAWDVAAGLLLVLEAGGRVSDWRGAPYRAGDPAGLIAGRAGIHAPLVEVLSAFQPGV
jgi:myo-inositol-1(or 4)-monophosphatase